MLARPVRLSALALLLTCGAAAAACGKSKTSSGASTGGAGGEKPGDSSGGKASGEGSAGESGGGGEAGKANPDDDQFFSGQWIDHDGTLYLADTGNCVIRKVDPEGVISTVAGTPGDCGDDGDDGPATAAKLNYPADVAIGPDGDLYIADSSNSRVRRVDAETGIISAFAGTGDVGSSGDDGPAQEAELNMPIGLVVDRDGNVFIADGFSHVVRRVAASDQTITTVAGTGTQGTSGNGGPATEADLYHPVGLALDVSGNLYVGTLGWVHKVAVDGTITSVAGTGNSGVAADDGPALEADVAFASGLAVDTSGHLYIVDIVNHAVRKVDATTSVLTTIAGTLGEGGDTGDGGLATSARLGWPAKLALDRHGHLYIGAIYNHRIRKVDWESGIITAVAGTGTEGFMGDGGPARDAHLAGPFDVVLHLD